MSIATKQLPKGWPRISSSLVYREAGKAIDWLCTAFGFEVQLKVEGEGGIIHHSELIAVIEGTLEFHHDGKVERVGPGGILYVAYETNHQVRNAGGTPARYVVVAIGGDIRS